MFKTYRYWLRCIKPRQRPVVDLWLRCKTDVGLMVHVKVETYAIRANNYTVEVDQM